MKGLLLSFIFITSCTSWNHKDFEKDLDKPSIEAEPAVSTSAKEEKLLEKFEVEEVKDTPKEEKKAPVPAKVEKKGAKTPAPKGKTSPKTTVTPIQKKLEVKAPVVKALPVGYPDHMLELNVKAKKVWDLYQPNHQVDQKVYLDIHYLGMTVGKIMVVNKGKKLINNKEVWHFHARFKSAPFYSNIYELDDTVDTYVTTDQFLSSRYSLVQRETKQDVDDLQLNDRDQLKTFWFYHQKKSNGDKKEKKKDEFIPFYSIDPFSVLFLYQGLPLKNGDVYEIPLINKAKILLLRSVVEGRETIQTEKGKRKAIRVHATTKYTGETLKSGDLYLWFSDDDKKVLIKAQAKIKIGSVTADIVDK